MRTLVGIVLGVVYGAIGHRIDWPWWWIGLGVAFVVVTGAIAWYAERQRNRQLDAIERKLRS